MKLEKRSDYANYLVLSDKSNNKLGSTFEKFLNFKKVKEVLNNMAFTDKSTFGFDGQLYKRKITSADAKHILSTVKNKLVDMTKPDSEKLSLNETRLKH